MPMHEHLVPARAIPAPLRTSVTADTQGLSRFADLSHVCSHLEPVLEAVRSCCQVLPVGEVSCTLTMLRLTSALLKGPDANPAKAAEAEHPQAAGQHGAALDPRSIKMACQFGLVWGVAATVGASDRAV